MSEGTGIDPLDELISIGTNISTAGTVGFGKDGFKQGVTVSGLKEVTGAKAAEEANEQAREQFEISKNQALQDRETSKKQNERRQISASRSAGRIKNNVNTHSGSTVGGTQTDVLGL